VSIQLAQPSQIEWFNALAKANGAIDPATPQAKNGTPLRPGFRRFTQETQFGAGVAFDTQTGQLCRTWDWNPVGKLPVPDAAGNVPQRSLGEFTPTCLSVYQRFSSSGYEQQWRIEDFVPTEPETPAKNAPFPKEK
jgi:hypothetical protein